MSATSRSPFSANATPFVTIACVVPGGLVLTVRPTPAATPPTSLRMEGMRNASTPAPPPAATFQTVPTPRLPSLAHRLPSRSNAIPFACGTPVAYTVAVGGTELSGASRAIASRKAPDPVM